MIENSKLCCFGKVKLLKCPLGKKKIHTKTSKQNGATLLEITNSLHLPKRRHFGKCKELKEKTLDPTQVTHEKTPTPHSLLLPTLVP
jgi:hypothetical protein